MKKILSAKGMERLNSIAMKYRFRNQYEIEQEDVYNFCDSLLYCVQFGLNIDKQDFDFLIDVRDTLIGDRL